MLIKSQEIKGAIEVLSKGVRRVIALTSKVSKIMTTTDTKP
jgi:hypothetical protein